MQILKAGLLYFALVFGAGFVLGPIRIWWAVPRFGTIIGELMEAPIMFVITIAAARWVVRRLAVPSIPSYRLGMGCVALSLLLTVEFTLVLWLGNSLLSDTCGVRHHASSRRSKMRVKIETPFNFII
jgi:hypothetical protein